MKRVGLLLLLFIVYSANAQRDMTPGKRSNSPFGKADYNDYRHYGLQLTFGPTFMLTKAKNTLYNTADVFGRPIDYSFDPSGKLGFFIEAGLAHFPKKRSKLSLALRTVLVSYYDWGIGFKYLGGNENTSINYYNALGQKINTVNGNGTFYNGYLFGRFAMHKNINLSKKYFIDNGLGVNLDFRLIEGSKDYDYNGPSIPIEQRFHNAFVGQINYSLSFGIKLSRRDYLIPGAQIPIMGLYEWRNGCAALKWFSSNYVPLQLQVKWIHLFKKKVKGCNTPGSDEDRKKDKEYRQNI